MFSKDNYYLVPASPELRARFLRTKELLQAGEPLAEEATIDVLDLRTFSLISSRRKCIHTITGASSPVVGTRRALVLLVDFSDNKATQNQKHYADIQ